MSISRSENLTKFPRHSSVVWHPRFKPVAPTLNQKVAPMGAQWKAKGKADANAELVAIEAGAQDFEAATEDEASVFITDPVDLDWVSKALTFEPWRAQGAAGLGLSAPRAFCKQTILPGFSLYSNLGQASGLLFLPTG